MSYIVLPRVSGGGIFFYPERSLKKAIIFHLGNGFVVALTEDKNTDIVADDIDGGNILGFRQDLLQLAAQFSKAINPKASKRQTGMGWIEFVLGLFDDEFAHFATRWAASIIVHLSPLCCTSSLYTRSVFS